MVTVGWEGQQKAGTIELRVSTNGAPQWCGHALPITSSGQLTSEQLVTPIAYFVGGKLLCVTCTGSRKDRTYPSAISVAPSHIIPHSQNCHQCSQLLVSIERDKHGPVILYKKYMSMRDYKRMGYK